MRHLPWQFALNCVLLVLASPFAQAAAPKPPGITPAASTAISTSAVRAVTTVAAGQAGYVHYFRLTHQDGTLEDQVGIELEDQRIAWSFPGAGVIVSDFISNGALNIAGETFVIEHLHGVRPFRTAREMQNLRNDLSRRVAFWVDDQTPYCIFRQPGEPFCLNCGDFVVRILYPVANPLMVGLPAELTSTFGNTPTADDLLMHMLGLHNLPDAKSRLGRLAALDLPDTLRRDVMELLQPGSQVVAGSMPGTTSSSTAPDKKPSRVATRRTQSRRL